MKRTTRTASPRPAEDRSASPPKVVAPATVLALYRFDFDPRRRGLYIKLGRIFGRECAERASRLLAIDRTDDVGNHLQLYVRCAKGHEFWIHTRHVEDRRYWCQDCRWAAEREERWRRCAAHARDKGGELLTPQYVNARTTMRWVCDRSHAWSASADSVVRLGTWCPVCATQAWADARRGRPRKPRSTHGIKGSRSLT